MKSALIDAENELSHHAVSYVRQLTWHPPCTICCVYRITDTDAADAADDGADIAEFNESSSDKTISVVRGHTAIITCRVPSSAPSPPEVTYWRDGRPFTLTCELAVHLLT